MQAASQREETEWRVQSKIELMQHTGLQLAQQVNINIMEYSERNVRQLTLNEQEDTSPGKLMLV